MNWADTDKQERGHEGGNNEHEQQHHQPSHKRRDRHADPINPTTQSTLYHDWVRATIPRDTVQTKCNVPWSHHLRNHTKSNERMKVKA